MVQDPHNVIKSWGSGDHTCRCILDGLYTPQ